MATSKKTSPSKTSQTKQAKESTASHNANKKESHQVRKAPQKISRISQSIRDQSKNELLNVWEREEAAWVQATLNSVMDAIITIDEEQGVIFFNKGAEMIFRCPSVKAIGQSIDQFIPQGFRIIHQAHGRQFKQAGSAICSANPVGTQVARRFDGEEFLFEASISQFDFSGKNRWTVILRDITERQKAEQEVHQLWKRNDQILHSTGEGIYGVDVKGNATFFNRAAEKLTGWTWQEVKGRSLHSLLHHTWEDGSPYPWEQCPVYSSVTSGDDRQVETEILWHKDGTSFPVFYFCSPIRNAQNIIEGAVVSFKDISARKRAELALRESEERFQAFMDHSPVVAFLKNEQGQYVYVNWQFEESMHLSVAECLGKTDSQLFPPEVARVFPEHDQDLLKKKGVLESEETTLDETGQLRFWWVMKFLVYRKDGKTQLGGVALDITSRKKIEEALRRREEELQSSQELLRALGGALISAQEDERRRISRELHDDMNQRLAVLALNLQSALKEFGTLAPVKQVLRKLYDEVVLLSDDVRHLAYQLHPSILDDLGLEVALREFISEFSQWENLQVAFACTSGPCSPSPQVASCLYRITQESLRNVARHATATQVDVKLIGDGDDLTLSIKDNGKGFSFAEMRKNKVGLGLLGMEERVRLVQGTFEVKSARGQGTEILVWVPMGGVTSPRGEGQ